MHITDSTGTRVLMRGSSLARLEFFSSTRVPVPRSIVTTKVGIRRFVNVFVFTVPRKH